MTVKNNGQVVDPRTIQKDVLVVLGSTVESKSDRVSSREVYEHAKEIMIKHKHKVAEVEHTHKATVNSHGREIELEVVEAWRMKEREPKGVMETMWNCMTEDSERFQYILLGSGIFSFLTIVVLVLTILGATGVIKG